MATERKVYNFASVGETEQEKKDRYNIITDDAPIGIATPIRLSRTNSSFFEMHTDLKKQIRDNFKNMISTNHGERMMLVDFGGNLSDLAYELGSESIDAVAMRRITATTQKYMPYVVLNSFEPMKETSIDEKMPRTSIIVTFTVPTLGIDEQKVKISIDAAG